MSEGAAPGRSRAALFGVVALLLLGTAVPLAATPASAIGTSVEVNVHPPRVVGIPTADGPGPANLSADAVVYGSSTGGSLVWTVTTTAGWAVSPSPTKTDSVPAGGGQFRFDFQVMVPPDAPADVASGVEVRAEFRVGPATIATGVGGASVEAGRFYAASVHRVGPSDPMSPGHTYVIPYDIVNEGNTGAALAFVWTDPGLNSRLKADFIAPTGLSVGGSDNVTAEFRVTPQGTTPAGTYAVPVQLKLTDRSGEVYGVVNFTIEMKFDNLPYPGILPRFDLQGIEALLGWVGVILVLWLLMNAGIAFARRKDYDEEDGMPFVQAYAARLSHTLLYRGLRKAVKRGGKKRRRARRADEA